MRRVKLARLGFLLLFAVGVGTVWPVSDLGWAGERFGNYEIRVIRPKYMAKRKRIEMAGQLSVVMNQPFIYTYMATGLLDYHFSEQLALEMGGSFGISVDKDDKRLLKEEFNIQTRIKRTQYMAEGALLWTPIYGKFQMSSGRLVYFDTFLSGGGGMSGIDYTYEHCISPSVEKPARRTVGYPTFMVGGGQKFFISRQTSIRWDVRDHIFMYNTADGSCDPESEGASEMHQNVTLQLGASRFF